MTKNKKICIFGCILGAVILVLLILMFTVFALKNIEFKAHNATDILTSSEAKQDVVEMGGLKLNSSVLFLNKQKVINKIEKNAPSLKIINIETKFPNKIVIHFAEREELFAIKCSEERYIVTDADLKVIRIVENSDDGYSSSRKNPILVTGLTIQNLNAKKGDFIKIKDNEEILKQLSASFLLNNRDVVEQKSLISKINFKSDQNHEIISGEGVYFEIVDFNDFSCNIYSPSLDLTQKINVYLSGMPDVMPLYFTSHYMEIYTRSSGEIFCKLTLKSQ